MDLHYEVTYILNGEEHTTATEAASAAAASEQVRQQVSGDEDTYELIQVHMLDNQPES